jgi:lipopolysaccharide transport system permease protein
MDRMTPDAPTTDRRPLTVIEPRRGLFHLDLGELWRYRELGFYLVWRDIKVRYKQTVIGATWAIISPIVLMVVFTFVFGRVRSGAPEGTAPAIWFYAALLPWGYFAQAIATASGSVVGAGNMIKKVYFPRLILPIHGVLPGLVDFAMSFAVLFVLMIAFDVPITLRLFVIPLLIAITGATAFGAGMWLSAMNALYRDIRELVPFALQILLFTSPILLPRTRIPGRLLPFYALNPIAGVVEGSRWAVLGIDPFPWDFVLPGLGTVALLIITGLIYFRRMEDVIVDVV